METNPLAPRQRNRRADRQANSYDAPAVQPGYPVPQPAQQSVQPAPQLPPAQPVQQAAPQPVRSMYQQPAGQQSVRPTAASYQQQPAAQQSVRPTAANYQQQPAYSQQAYRPMQPSVPQTMPQPGPQTQAAPRPRALNQTRTVDSGWSQPAARQPMEAPHARAERGLSRDLAREEKAARREAKAQAAREEKARRSEAAQAEKPVRKKLPGWLTTALSLALILVLALVAAYYLMEAYLVTQEKARIAAYEATLNNYHITESSDGTLRVTWQEHIERYAAQYNLQPAFVTAIIRNESSFRTNAESNVGARGLMQLMPDTAEWIAGKLNDSSYHFDRMWDAETNIRYGCWYLGYLSRLFRGDAELVSAAYHAGQTTVTQWLSDPDKSSDGITLDLDRLNDGPTKQYIGRVTQTYGIYQTLLYPDEAFGSVPAGSNDAAAGMR